MSLPPIPPSHRKRAVPPSQIHSIPKLERELRDRRLAGEIDQDTYLLYLEHHTERIKRQKKEGFDERSKTSRKTLNRNAPFWRGLLNPLTREMDRIRLGIKYYEERSISDDRDKFIRVYTKYLEALELLRTEMRIARDEGKTVTEFREYWQAKTFDTLPYPEKIHANGWHWTDYVPHTLKVKALQAFGKLPRRRRMHVPFRRIASEEPKLSPGRPKKAGENSPHEGEPTNERTNP